MEKIFAKTVHFSGHVQGVGFRYATQQTAREFEVCGEVKNLTDGRVKLVAEGAETEVKSFVESLKDRMANYIRSTDEAAEERPRQYDTFSITH